MEYLLPCSCGQKTRIAAAQAGAQVQCACGKSLSVPTLRGIRELEIAPPETGAKSVGRWSPIHGAFFASGLAIASIGIIFLAFFGLKYVQLGGHPLTRDITNDVVQAEQQRIDKLTPTQALLEWTEDLKEGLGEIEEPPWIRANKVLAGYRYAIRASVAAVVIGIAFSVLALILPRGTGG